MGQYLFDNAGEQSSQRFDSLAVLFDPNTIRHLERLGVSDGWRCLEVGGGGGSIAAWLARRASETGHVLVTDIDTRHLAPLEVQGLPNLTVQRHDVERDPLSAGAFDLIHERLVLSHLPTAEQALCKLVDALKPGGWLLVEDFDPPLVEITFPTADRAAAAVVQRVQDAVIHLLALHGNPPLWGRMLYQRLRDAGLLDVGMEGHLAIGPGGSAVARLRQANYEQVRAEAIERGLVTEREIEEALSLLEDPSLAISTAVMLSAWGRRSPA
jgi:SAM-dependent methyltransferase